MPSRRQRKRIESERKAEEDKEPKEPITHNIQPHDVFIKVKWDFGFRPSTED